MQHPPYSIFDYSLDLFWSFAFLLAAWLSRRTEIKRKRVFFGLCVALIPARFLAPYLVRLRFPSELFDLFAFLYLSSVAITTIWRAIHMNSVPPPQNEKTA
jgi:hypothetical protein